MVSVAFLTSAVAAVLSLLPLASAQSASGPFPAVAPLAVRSPYFNAWVKTSSGSDAPLRGTVGRWPMLWTGHVLGWSGFVRVDGVGYRWQGAAAGWLNATLANATITPTRTRFTYQAGPVQFNVTYLNPIEPNDWILQSFPFSYITIDGVLTTDNRNHVIQFLYDTTGEWLSSEQRQSVKASSTHLETWSYHEMKLDSTSLMSDWDDQSSDGTLYLAMLNSSRSGVTWQVGDYRETHDAFSASGNLFNSVVLQSPAPSNSIVGAYAIDFGNISSSSLQHVFALGYARNPSIRVTTTIQGTREEALRSPYFISKFANIPDAIGAFLADYPQAVQRADAVDTRLMSDARNISSQYSDLASLAARTVLGSIDITIPSPSSNPKQDTSSSSLSSTQAFMKDVGNGRRINAVETLYAAFPALLYFNGSLAGALLAPLLESQNTPGGPHWPYALPDLGTVYPDATPGQAQIQESLGIEHTGSMMVMLLAHAQKSGDGGLIAGHHNLLKVWGDYLVNHTCTEGATSADGSAFRNNTNLVLKAIVGIKAMSEINRLLEPIGAPPEHTERFANASQRYISQWTASALGNNQITGNLGDSTSWGLMYNIYADMLLDTKFVNSSILSTQTAAYMTQVASAQRFGLPLDSSSQDQARSDWTMFAAATTTNTNVRDAMISVVAKAPFDRDVGTTPWATKYDPITGRPISGRASPALGAVFAPLALHLPNAPFRLDGLTLNTRSFDSTPPDSPHSRSSKAPVIVGGVVGGLSGIGFIALAIIFYRRWALKRASASPKMAPSKEFGYYTKTVHTQVRRRYDAAAARFAQRGGSGSDEGAAKEERTPSPKPPPPTAVLGTPLTPPSVEETTTTTKAAQTRLQPKRVPPPIDSDVAHDTKSEGLLSPLPLSLPPYRQTPPSAASNAIRTPPGLEGSTPSLYSEATAPHHHHHALPVPLPPLPTSSSNPPVTGPAATTSVRPVSPPLPPLPVNANPPLSPLRRSQFEVEEESIDPDVAAYVTRQDSTGSQSARVGGKQKEKQPSFAPLRYTGS